MPASITHIREIDFGRSLLRSRNANRSLPIIRQSFRSSNRSALPSGMSSAKPSEQDRSTRTSRAKPERNRRCFGGASGYSDSRVQRPGGGVDFRPIFRTQYEPTVPSSAKHESGKCPIRSRTADCGMALSLQSARIGIIHIILHAHLDHVVI